MNHDGCDVQQAAQTAHTSGTEQHEGARKVQRGRSDPEGDSQLCWGSTCHVHRQKHLSMTRHTSRHRRNTKQQRGRADLEAGVSHGGEGLGPLAGDPGVLHHLLQAQPRLRLLHQYLWTTITSLC